MHAEVMYCLVRACMTGRSATPDCFKYLALAIESHMVGLLQAMAKASRQRGDPSKYVTCLGLT